MRERLGVVRRCPAYLDASHSSLRHEAKTPLMFLIVITLPLPSEQRHSNAVVALRGAWQEEAALDVRALADGRDACDERDAAKAKAQPGELTCSWERRWSACVPLQLVRERAHLLRGETAVVL